jgi:mannobiose 2-epimerase
MSRRILAINNAPALRLRLERILLNNILPFWMEQSIDREHGGYRLNHSRDGVWGGPVPKALVVQARMLWFFSRIARSGFGGHSHLEAARHGFRFLDERMWDPEHGGYFWEVSSPGNVATKPDKHLYAQAFALFALSEYAIASGEEDPLHRASKLFELLDDRAHDPDCGGYFEWHSRDWRRPPEALYGLLGVPGSVKLMNTHLHLLEGIDRYAALSGNVRARERLEELIDILTRRTFRLEFGAFTDRFTRTWEPVRTPVSERVSYGHDLELIWLVAHACRTLGRAETEQIELFRTVAAVSLRHGFDTRNGGFFTSGPAGAPADRREKSWWVQSESLVACLKMHVWTGDASYAEAFKRTLEWIERRQVDWEHGEWHETVHTSDGPTGMKAGPWKSAYHNGRAMLECIELLGQLD